MQKSDSSKQNAKKEDLGKRYTIEKIIGTGTFGQVYLALDKETNERVAIKKVFQDKRFKNREHQIISELKHPNIVRLNTSFFTKGGEKPDDVYLNLVMEFVPQTLSREIRENRKARRQMNPIQLKIFSYQMIRAMAYQQALGLAHRDIKPQNILIDTKTNLLKICDYGSAKKLIPGQENISYICSRYYRSPELIFGATQYNTIIDMWSIGCVMVEMVTGEPIFPGQSAVDQLIQIIQILGTPTTDEVKQLNPHHQEYKFPIIKAQSWNRVLGKHKVDPLFIDLIQKILVYSPKIRWQPLQCLGHKYFDDLRDQDFYKLNSRQINIPNFFDWTNEEKYLGRNIIKQITPQWYLSKMQDSQQTTSSSQQQQSTQLKTSQTSQNNSKKF